MTKSLEQIQQENRKFILEAIHGCSYEEALEKELGVGCKVIDKMHLFCGDTLEEAKKNAEEALRLHVEGLQDSSKLPTPSIAINIKV